jgi:hypothetical protein
MLTVEAVTDRPKPHDDDDDDEFMNIAMSMHNDCSSTAYRQSVCLPLQYPLHLHFPLHNEYRRRAPVYFES